MNSDCNDLVCLESGSRILSYKENAVYEDDRALKKLMKLDDQHVPSQSYFENQTDLRPDMRKTVAEWMLDVCDEQKCNEDVFVTSVNYLDRVLAKISVKRTQLQLFAASCMLIASKLRDTLPISIRLLVMYTDWSVTPNELQECELTVLQVLRWEISIPSPYDFLDQFLFRIKELTDSERSSLRRHSSILITVCTVEPKFMVCPPSLVGAACLCSASSGLLGRDRRRALRLHHTVRKITSIDKEALEHHQHQIEELLAERMSRSEENFSGNGEVVSKSPSSGKRQPCTPTDVLDVKLTA